MDSWWSLGEGSGYNGQTLPLHMITCPFCLEKDNFSVVGHFEKKKPNSSKKLNFDTLECGNCKGYVMSLWSTSEHSFGGGLTGFKVLPFPLQLNDWPEEWPDSVGRYWLQAKRNLNDGNWDASAVMARSSLQIALRDKEAKGKTLKQEIDDLADRGILPPIMKDWSDEIRLLGNDSAHPDPVADAIDPNNARDIVKFLDFLLEYLYTLPHQISEYKERQKS